MKLSASNIAWESKDDCDVYNKLKVEGFSALEIAPTRLIPQKPYQPENIVLATSLVKDIKNNWGFGICSMQSLWYGLTERIFGTSEEREFLYNYTCAALDFAAAINCPHVVFGSPRNRIIDHTDQLAIGEKFFAACADYAETKNVVIGIEANPISYGTNYLNTTTEALALVKNVNSPNFKLNLDLGTLLDNQEDLKMVENFIPYVSHVHISEPALMPIISRPEHQYLAQILEYGGYQGWISIEMKNSGKSALFQSIERVSGVFKK